MYGYIIPDKMNMYMKDYTLFRAYYCGLCKSLGKTGSQFTRFLTSYDLTFFNALLHSLNKVDVEIANEVCVLNPVKKKSVVKTDKLSVRVADVAVLLAYYNVVDDIVDGEKAKAFLKSSLALRVKKAMKNEPAVAVIVEKMYHDLRIDEKNQVEDVDKLGDHFAKMMQQIAEVFVVDIDEPTKNFCYALGKLVYLFDAIDDVEKDIKSSSFNPFVKKGNTSKTKIEFIEANKSELDFCFNVCYADLVENYNQMKIFNSEGVLSNIVYLGIKMQMEKLLKGEEKCAKTRL